MSCQYLRQIKDFINVASTHIGAAYKTVNAATVALPVCVAPLLFVIIRANDNAACDAFSEAYIKPSVDNYTKILDLRSRLN